MITLNQVNRAPALPSIADQTIDELAAMTVDNTASDPDLTANSLTYRLLSPWADAVIHPSGVITWTPDETQGPSTNVFVTVVTDNGTPTLSATNRFTVIVREVNSAPTLASIADQRVGVGANLNLTVTATDSDVPKNTLTFGLLTKPPTAAIDAATGVFSWTTSSADEGTTNSVTVQVTDNGSPNLSETKSFAIFVGGSLEITGVSRNADKVTLIWSATPGKTYRVQYKNELNQESWLDLNGDVTATGLSASKEDDTLTLVQRRFYRVQLRLSPLQALGR